VGKIANVLRMKSQFEKISAIGQTNLIRFRENVKDSTSVKVFIKRVHHTSDLRSISRNLFCYVLHNRNAIPLLYGKSIY
jgi:hypothetical protein